MSDRWTPQEVLSNPQSEALKKELEKWTIVIPDDPEDPTTVKLYLKA